MFYFKKPICIDSIGSVFVRHLEEKYRFSGHIHHAHWEMVYIIDGYVGVTADDRIIKCRPGSIIFHQPGEFHRLWNEGTDESVIMVVSFTAKGDSLDSLREKIFALTVDEISIAQKLQDMILKNAIKKGSELTARPAFNDDEFLTSQFVTLLEHLFYCCVKSDNAVTSKGTKDSLLFSRAVRSMKLHIRDTLTIKDFADELQISQSHLKRLFRRYAQTGVHEYSLTLKINHAKTLLSQGESVYQTALTVGFTDQNYFSTAFKRITGVPPSKWIEVD